VGPKEEIAFAESHAAAMREQIANSHFVGDIRVVHLKAREALVDGIVPGDFAFVDERGESAGGESLGIGADSEQCIFFDGSGVAEFAKAVAFGEKDFAVLDDGNGEAGDLESFQDARDVGVEVGGRRRLRGC